MENTSVGLWQGRGLMSALTTWGNRAADSEQSESTDGRKNKGQGA
jgi:hypothetical protein